MPAHENEWSSTTEAILAAAFEVGNALGPGFLEKVYERAMVYELKLRGLRVAAQASFPVLYKGYCAGEYFADMLVEDQVVVELKCVDHVGKEHLAQCLNYLQASRKPVCLLINFNRPKIEWRRILASGAAD